MAPRIWTGIAAPVAVVSILLLVIAVSSAWYIRNMQESVAVMLTHNVTSMRAAQVLELSVRDLRNQGARYLITADPQALEPIPQLRKRAMTALHHAESLAGTPAEQQLMRQTRSGLQTFFTEYDRMTEGHPDRADYAKTLTLVDTVLAKEVIEPTRQYLRLNEEMLAHANEENRRLASRITTGLITLGLCGAFGGLLGGWVLSAAHRRRMLKSEERLRSTARQLDEAARIAEDSIPRAKRSADALDDVAKSASAVLARLKQTERDALRAEQLAWAGQMAAGIAHEVRNPLMAIKLLIQALADGRTGDRLRPRDIQVLEEEIIRLEQIISSFLDFARPPRPDKKPVAVAQLAEQVAERIRNRADLQAVTIEVIAPRLPVVAVIDPNQLQQVLYNLFFNALDAQPNGGRIRVYIRTEAATPVDATHVSPSDGAAQRQSTASFVEISVEDEGSGLPERLSDRVFEPFVSTKEAGMGLGLSICRRIMESHDGEIRASNRREGGAVFTLRFPFELPLTAPIRNGVTPLPAHSQS